MKQSSKSNTKCITTNKSHQLGLLKNRTSTSHNIGEREKKPLNIQHEKSIILSNQFCGSKKNSKFWQTTRPPLNSFCVLLIGIQCLSSHLLLLLLNQEPTENLIILLKNFDKSKTSSPLKMSLFNNNCCEVDYVSQKIKSTFFKAPYTEWIFCSTKNLENIICRTYIQIV